MPKDSQPDNKKARLEKSNYQIPLTRENMNKNKNAKRQSIKNNDVWGSVLKGCMTAYEKHDSLRKFWLLIT